MCANVPDRRMTEQRKLVTKKYEDLCPLRTFSAGAQTKNVKNTKRTAGGVDRANGVRRLTAVYDEKAFWQRNVLSLN